MTWLTFGLSPHSPPASPLFSCGNGIDRGLLLEVCFRKLAQLSFLRMYMAREFENS